MKHVTFKHLLEEVKENPLWLFVAFVLLSKRKPLAERVSSRLLAGMTAFPVTTSAASFSNDYVPEATSTQRKHMGVDIFAASGTAVLAPEDGQVRFTTDPKGGNVFYLTGGSGTTYYGAHMTGFVGKDRAVQAGEQIGFVGTTGNAAGKAAHLHLQINGGKTNPYPLLHALLPNAPVAPWARQGNA